MSETQAWTAERHAAAKERCEAATPGSWNEEPLNGDEVWTSNWMIADTKGNISNADFIAHARQDVPDMLAEIERLQARPTTAQLQAALDERDAARAEVTQLRARLAAAEAVVEAAKRVTGHDRIDDAYPPARSQVDDLDAALDTYDTVRAALAEAGR